MTEANAPQLEVPELSPAAVGAPVQLLFEASRPGRRGIKLPQPVGEASRWLPVQYLASARPGLPQLSELDVVRHYTRLAQRNYSIDAGFYPLGSCTMKYNPRVNEQVAALPGWAHLHPEQPESDVQGALALLWSLERMLAEISGMEAVSLQPAAGAHGELTGLLIIAAHHRAQGQLEQRRVVLVPDSAHGTNPASAAIAGFEVEVIRSTAEGQIDLADLRAKLSPRVAALMLTNPSTLGLFERDIAAVAEAVHEVGGLLYYDGANLNAIAGKCRPGDMGFDVVHFNVHKTFSTPHGGGGPGAGPVGVRAALVPYLPVPVVAQPEPDRYAWDWDRPHSIGKVRGGPGHVGVLVRAYAYIRYHGAAGLVANSETAVLNANYLLSRLRERYQPAYDRHCMHEAVLSGRRQKVRGARTLDVVKRLMDYGFHPPTIYFPQIVDECLMIEPTETESKETIDAFCDAMLAVDREVEERPELVRSAPHSMVVRRVDEAAAARQPNLRWRES